MVPLSRLLPDTPKISSNVSPRFLAIKLLEKDRVFKDKVVAGGFSSIISEAEKQTGKLERLFQEDTETVITDARYGFIAGAMKETYKENPQQRRRKTDIIDSVLTHRLFGFPFSSFLSG